MTDTVIKINNSTYEQLIKIGKKQDNCDSIIQKLIETKEKYDELIELMQIDKEISEGNYVEYTPEELLNL